MRSRTTLPAAGREAGVKTAVENSEGNRIAQDLLMRDQHSIQVVDVVRCRLRRGFPDDLKLDKATALEGIGQVCLRQGKKEIERSEQSSRLEVGDIGAASMSRIDDAKNGERPQRLAKAGPADVQNLDEVAFGWQPVAGTQHAGPDEIENAVNDGMSNSLLRVHPRLGIRHRRFWSSWPSVFGCCYRQISSGENLPQLGTGACSPSLIHRNRPLIESAFSPNSSTTRSLAFSGSSPPVSSTQRAHSR